jgi:hypothetical protein
VVGDQQLGGHVRQRAPQHDGPVES